MGSFPRCVGISLFAWFSLEQAALAIVMVVFDCDGENKKFHCQSISHLHTEKISHITLVKKKWKGFETSLQAHILN